MSSNEQLRNEQREIIKDTMIIALLKSLLAQGEINDKEYANAISIHEKNKKMKKIA